DNKNRTAAEVRHLFGKYGGNLGETGCVSYNFERLGQITVEAGPEQEDAIMEIALEAGADDVEYDGEDTFTVTTAPRDEVVETVRKGLEDKELKVSGAEIKLVPQNLMKLDASNAKGALKMYDAFDDHDDVQSIATNFEI